MLGFLEKCILTWNGFPLKLWKYWIYFPLACRIQGSLCFQGHEEGTLRVKAVQNLEKDGLGLRNV